MKIGVSSYSFQQMLRSGAETQLSLIKKAKDMGFDGIEFTDLNVPEGSSEADYAARLREESERTGLPIISYTVGANLLSEHGLAAETERLCRKVEIAEILGVSCMRHDAVWGMPEPQNTCAGFDQALPTLIDGCRQVTAFAKAKGIVTMTENHGFFCQESARVERLITGVGDPNFGALIDLGNFACADEDSAAAVGRLAPYAKHVHAKDFHLKSGNGFDPGRGFFRSRGGNYLRGAIIGQGNIPVLQCLRVLAQSGYDGYVSVEFEGMEPCEDGVAIGRENLARMLAALAD